jgi:hypothetical protein
MLALISEGNTLAQIQVEDPIDFPTYNDESPLWGRSSMNASLNILFSVQIPNLRLSS